MSNPFLFTEEVGTTQLSNSNASFNPFLASNDGSSENDNPFMSSIVGSQNVFESSTTATNPFALGTDSTAEINFFSTQNNSLEQTSINYENIFSSQPQTELDLFSQVPSQIQNQVIQNDLMPSTETSTNLFGGYESGYEETDRGPPRRPPPPRPGPPKETKDLILSVTGAMEATSSHLLDRLQATRTPSPTPMRDLHSPSPTQFGDLLEVDEPSGITGPKSQPPQHQEVNLLGDEFDFPPVKQEEPSTIKRPSIGDGTMAPITPVPLENEHIPPIAPVAKPAIPPSRPAPPSIPERPRVPPQPPRPQPPIPSRPKTPEITPSATPQQIVSPPQLEGVQELPSQPQQIGFDDVFGMGFQATEEPTVVAPTVPISSPPDVTAADNLISGAIQKIQTAATDVEPMKHIEPSEQPFKEPATFVQEVVPPTTAPLSPLLTNLQPTTPPAPPPTANVINEEASVDIFDMGFTAAVPSTQPTMGENLFDVDQSDSAFGSDSSNQPMTNEFRQEEPISSAPSSQPFNIFDAFGSNPSQLPQQARQDDFDAFAAKFESAALSDATVKADPFDPFSSSFQKGATIAGEK